MPARTVRIQKARRALITDTRFNHPDAAMIGDLYLPRLIRLTQKKIALGSDATYVDILWLQAVLGIEALANGYPHLPKSGYQKGVLTSLKCAITKQQRELSRMPKVSHENVELGNLTTILNLPLAKNLQEELRVSLRDVIETDPGCVLSVLVTYWLR